MPLPDLPPIMNGYLRGDIIRDEVISNYPDMPETNILKLVAVVQRKLREAVGRDSSVSAEDQLAFVLVELDRFSDSIPIDVNKLSASKIVQILCSIFPDRLYDEKTLRKMSTLLSARPDFIGQKYIQHSWLIELAEQLPYTKVDPEEDVMDFASLEHQVLSLFDAAFSDAARQRQLGKIRVTPAEVLRHLRAYCTFSVSQSDIASAILFLHDRRFSRGSHAMNGHVAWRKRTENKA